MALKKKEFIPEKGKQKYHKNSPTEIIKISQIWINFTFIKMGKTPSSKIFWAVDIIFKLPYHSKFKQPTHRV